MESRKSAEKGDSNDLFSKLLAAKDPETGESLSPRQLWAESNLLIIAGISSAEVCQGPKLSSCVYLRACITEATRMSPPAPGSMWREVLPGGLTVGELHLPAGYDVGTGIYAINHNSKYFPEPFKFQPERWLVEEVGEEALLQAKAAYGTFSVGPRNCVGKSLAMTEICLAMAAVICDHEFRLDETHLGRIGEGKGAAKEEYQLFWTFTSIKNGPYIQFRPLEDGSGVVKQGKFTSELEA
ncbi:hypothetical protein EsH8_XII_000091 [Colletotrichum jinshuiense]